MTDPYQILGVANRATDDEIKHAYRALAKKFHPDGNKGNTEAVRRFQEVTGAYEFLKDARRRARFDRGEIDASGTRIRRGRTPPERTGVSPAGGVSRERAHEMFSELFGLKATANSPAPEREQAPDTRYRLTIGFVDAARGTTRRVRLPSGTRLDVRIPPGVEDGQLLRLKGQGGSGAAGVPQGDALITVGVEPHPEFSRSGRDVHLDVPITVFEAVKGGKIPVLGLEGPLILSLPPGLRGGEVFRLKGKGIAPIAGEDGEPGDQIVTVRVILPNPEDRQFQKLVRRWAPKGAYQVREDPIDGGET